MCFGIKQFFTFVTFVWLFSTVPAHMTLQISGSKWCIIALFALMRLFSNMFFSSDFKMRFCEEYRTAMVTFVRLFPTMPLQMYPQIAWLVWPVIALIAFKGFIPTKHFHMHAQTVGQSTCISTLITNFWPFSAVYFQMWFQQKWLVWHIITLVALEGFIPSMFLKVSPQRTWVGAFVITLTTFVWLFSTVPDHMQPKRYCVRGGKVAKVAFVLLLPFVYYWMSFKISNIRGNIVTLSAFMWVSRTVHFYTLWYLK